MKIAKSHPGFFKKKVHRVCYLCNDPGLIVRIFPKNPMGQSQNAGDFVTKHLRNQTRSFPTDFVTTFSYPKEID